MIQDYCKVNQILKIVKTISDPASKPRSVARVGLPRHMQTALYSTVPYIL